MRHARTVRKAPLTDWKVIASWNGLTISAFARAGRAFDNKEYLMAAERTARFVLNDLTKDGRLHRSRLEGLGPLGFLDDYAFTTAGFIDLFEATGKPQWLKAALRHQSETDRLFAAADGGYHMTGIDGELLITREKPGFDGAIPSGNSVAAMNLFRLYALTTAPGMLKKGIATVSAFIDPRKNPAPFSGMVAALDFHLAEPLALVLMLPESHHPNEKDALDTLASLYTPYAVAAPVREGEATKELLPILPTVGGKAAQKGSPTLYPCRNGTCKLPVTDVEAFEGAVYGDSEPKSQGMPPAGRG
jgi:uncharacterized protein YyaL (SSP411 family)